MDFRPIKPWGNVGDRKNDGYIKSKGIYYQVYAPEDIRKSYMDALKKLKNDFEGLIKQWSPVNEFYFVINDKYRGASPDCEIEIQKIKEVYSLKNAGVLLAKDMENMLFELDDDQIINIVGYLPDPANIKEFDYSILNEVIVYIMEQPIDRDGVYNLTVPDWDEKIRFNNLSKALSEMLMKGLYHIGSLEKFLANSSPFLAEQIRDKINRIYCQERETKNGDELFWNMVDRLSPKDQRMYKEAVFTIMAKYFETCDIFDEPTGEGEG
ncbi:MAG: hypothetical protein GX166_05735 [Clostridiaceae bacterium]|nr:hypothetical protein [Clostridiaceae bacterium]